MQVGQTNRRAFIAGLGGAAAWPLVARAQQQTDKVWRVGYLSLSSAAENPSFSAFTLKLQDLGYAEGKNLRLDVRRAEGDYARLAPLAVELVSLVPDVIVSAGSAPTAALQGTTSSIPIVMSGPADPISSGFIKSFAKPGGNITGTSGLNLDLTAKSLELLHLVVPSAKRIAVLMSPISYEEVQLKQAYVASGALGLTLVPIIAPTSADFENAFNTMHRENCDALFVLSDPRISPKIVELADYWQLPAVYQSNQYTSIGGLMSYSANYDDLLRLAASYVDRILKGASPADLPVEQPTRLELRVNLKTARKLGLTIPDSILARADEVIE
jgi:putative tryptophan/tyrosine transport system substrate-binding protein